MNTPLNGHIKHQVALSTAAPATPEQSGSVASATKELESLRRILGAVGQSLNDIIGQLAAMKGDVACLTQRQDCMETLGRQVQMLTEQHYFEHIVSPECRRLFLIIDTFAEFIESSPIELTIDAALELLRAGREQLLEQLGGFGVQSLRADSDADFDPSWMQPGKVVLTSNRAQKDKVIRTIRCGYSRGERQLRPAIVEIYRYQPAQIRTSEPQANGELK